MSMPERFFRSISCCTSFSRDVVFICVIASSGISNTVFTVRNASRVDTKQSCGLQNRTATETISSSSIPCGYPRNIPENFILRGRTKENLQRIRLAKIREMSGEYQTSNTITQRKQLIHANFL